MKPIRWTTALVAATVGLAAWLTADRSRAVREPGVAEGYVYNDRNRNGRRDPGEEGLAAIRVSNQREIVLTNSEGRYRLPLGEEGIVFVIKPRDWMTPLSKENLPRFYYNHKPAGSPPSRYAGVAPTGELPPSIDFPLHARREPDRFRAILFADPQPRDQKEVDYVAHDVVEELIGFDAAFGVTLGDIMFDDLSLFESQNRSIALIGIPWYNVIGNHDLNFEALEDRYSDETFERVFGPSYYSFDHGPAHFIVLDDVEWRGRPEGYRGGLGIQQLEFVKRDLELIPKNQLVVLLMHIPLVNVADRHALYKLIEKRPFCISISGHTHYQEHRFIKRADGWMGKEPHHHIINVTVSGSWWSGAPDENGIPHTTMRDGAPNGYGIITFDGRKYQWEFRAARRRADYQMAIYAPEAIRAGEAAGTEVLANVFGGSERSRVELRVAGGSWRPMEKIMREDPGFAAVKSREEALKPSPGRTLPGIIQSPHIWRGTLPGGLEPGTREIEVRARDMFGKVHGGRRSIRVQ